MYHIIVNPTSCRGKRMKWLVRITDRLTELKLEYDVHLTQQSKQAIILTENLTTNPCDIIVFGGDGTLHEVLNGFSDFENCRLGLIPAGTGNDFARAVGIPEKPLDALDVIIGGEAKYTDYMQVGEARAINVVGTGIDVDILKRCRKMKLIKGKMQYLISLVISLMKFKSTRLKYEVNGQTNEEDSFIAAVGNGKYFGGGINICPKAESDDGKLDFVFCKFTKKRKIPSYLVKLLKSKVLELPITHFENCERLNVSSNKKYTMNLDGELYEDLPFEVSVVSGKLKMFRP